MSDQINRYIIGFLNFLGDWRSW